MRGYLSAGLAGTWEIGASPPLVLNLSIKWRWKFSFKPWPVL